MSAPANKCPPIGPAAAAVERLRAGGRRALPAAPSRVLFGAFALYLRRYMRRHLHAFRLSGNVPAIAPDQPAIIYLNHPSWWDPLACILLASNLFPNRTHYGPIDADGLARYPLLGRLGLFGVDSDPRRGAIDFLRASKAILARPGTMLWITAEGRFTDPRSRPVILRPGVAHLARRLQTGTLVPLALEYPFWQERTAEGLARFGEPIVLPQPHIAETSRWNELLERRLEQTQDELARTAMTRDADCFRLVLGGKAGVGGIYDLWRRTKAAVTGRRFVAEHGG
jgi:1-acyl-sn-glycerol-3-phosphate acyltransferase